MKKLLLALLLATTSLSAHAQQQPPVATVGTPYVQTGSAALLAGITSANVALGSSSSSSPPARVVVIENTGTLAAYVKLGPSNTVTASVTDFYVGPAQWQQLAIEGNKYLAAITATGATNLVISTGYGEVRGGQLSNQSVVNFNTNLPQASTTPEVIHNFKNTSANVFSVYATAGTTTGYLMVFNLTAVPPDGLLTGANTPKECLPLAALGTSGVNYAPGPAAVYGTGLAVALSAGVDCYNLNTAGMAGGYIHANFQ
jgi:hypothetical protein